MARQTILVTGNAGFIGYHTTKRLLVDGHDVVGLDNLNDYYDPALKQARLEQLAPEVAFRSVVADLGDRETLESLFDEYAFDKVVHLAAQAGVRYSLENPKAYIDSNIVGFLNILENCRRHGIGHLVYASSSSVYGLNEKTPFSEDDPVDHPASLYAATKKSNELLAHTYSHLFGLPTTGLRFFTVYGPWGRPDMAIFKFTKAILEERPIDVYNNGEMKRDFTYIDDIVEGVVRTVFNVPTPEPSNDLSSPASARAPFRIYNIGNNKPVELMRLISVLETILDREAKKNFLPMQPGDALETCADVDRLRQTVGFAPETDLDDGLRRFVDWYRKYYVNRVS